MAELGGGVDELELDLLEVRALGVGAERLAQRDDALLGADDGALWLLVGGGGGGVEYTRTSNDGCMHTFTYKPPPTIPRDRQTRALIMSQSSLTRP